MHPCSSPLWGPLEGRGHLSTLIPPSLWAPPNGSVAPPPLPFPQGEALWAPGSCRQVRYRPTEPGSEVKTALQNITGHTLFVFEMHTGYTLWNLGGYI